MCAGLYGHPVFSLEKRFSKHKMAIFSKNLGGTVPFAPLATPIQQTWKSFISGVLNEKRGCRVINANHRNFMSRKKCCARRHDATWREKTRSTFSVRTSKIWAFSVKRRRQSVYTCKTIDAYMEIRSIDNIFKGKQWKENLNQNRY